MQRCRPVPSCQRRGLASYRLPYAHRTFPVRIPLSLAHTGCNARSRPTRILTAPFFPHVAARFRRPLHLSPPLDILHSHVGIYYVTHPNPLSIAPRVLCQQC